MGANGEFSIIEELFAPLAKTSEGAFSLKDDVAELSGPGFVVTKDLMVAGVHFRKQDALDLVARKLMRSNISDLVAKGVRPKGYFLGCVWPVSTKRSQIEKFVAGLAHDQDIFKCSLFGGDTTRHADKTAPMMVSATFFGDVPEKGILKRSGALAGDDVYVTGTIGDGGLGLKVLEKYFKVSAEHKAFLSDRYWLPEPRMVFGSALSSFASSAMDVSDGLLADAAHLGSSSGLEIIIEAPLIPLSEAAQHFVQKAKDSQSALKFLATCGDDYEILFTAPTAMRRSVAMAAKASRTQVTRVGKTRRGEGLVLIDEAGQEESLSSGGGYNHFSD